MATSSTAKAVSFQPGDSVLVNAREQTSSDIKSNLYFPHYANLHGKILKLYGEEASVLVDRESLPGEIRTRHEEGERAMRQKWLDGLSEEARNRLSSKEKEFGLSYAILVSVNDLKPFVPGTAPKAAETIEESSAHRVSESELSAAEEAFLAERARTAGKKNGTAR